jgi:FkbM family methyltransferase
MKNNTSIKSGIPPVMREEAFRFELTTSCTDTDDLPRVPEAGQIIERNGVACQVMHCGVLVEKDCYYGPLQTRIVEKLRGFHEPQEEKIFHTVLRWLGTPNVMVELGSYWSYYSLWCRSVFPNIRNIMVEPVPDNLEVGRRNFSLNGFDGHFIQAAMGRSSAATILTDAAGHQVTVPVMSLPDVFEEEKIEHADLLLADIQGAETELLEGARELLSDGRVRFLFLSTHHYSISRDPLTHQRCLRFLRDLGATIVAEHTIPESFSGDGLIVASLDPRDSGLAPVEILRNRACNSLFREPEYDIAALLDVLNKTRT